MEESSRGCGEEQLNRIQRYYDLADKYDLKLVAGTFVKVPWSGRATEEDLCRNTKCLGFPFPDGQIRPGESELGRATLMQPKITCQVRFSLSKVLTTDRSARRGRM